MHELPGEHVNEAGGRQSKLYCEYRLLDAAAMHALTCVLHRGKKYGIDNWRLIPTHEHLNHAMNHIMSHIDYARLRGIEESKSKALAPSFCGRAAEDDLAHAFCRLMFALAKEIENYGIHPEHSDPAHHEPKTPPTEPINLRCSGSDIPELQTTSGLHQRERHTPADSDTSGRHDLERASQTTSRDVTGAGPSTCNGY